MKLIRSIEIKNSPFFQDTTLNFSENLNCIMGGRGTGKTTLLYFVKAAITKHAEEDTQLFNVLKNNLGDGTISLEIQGDDGNIFRITKTLGEEPQPYKLPTLEFSQIDKIFPSIECDIYEAGKIEKIGTNTRQRLELIDKKVGPIIHDLVYEIQKCQMDLESNAQDIKSVNRKILKLEQILAEFQNTAEDFENHKKNSPSDLNESERITFERADIHVKKRVEEKRFFVKLFETINEILTQLERIENSISDFKKTSSAEFPDSQNKVLMESAIQEMNKLFDSAIKESTSQKKNVVSSLVELGTIYEKLTSDHDFQQAEFVKLKQQFESNKEYLNKYHNLSKKITEHEQLKQDLQVENERKLRLNESRKELVKKLNSFKQKLFDVRLEAVNTLNKTFDGDIVIKLIYGGIINEFEEKLKTTLRGSGMRYSDLAERIAEVFSPDDFAAVIQEKKIDRLKEVIGIAEERANALVEVLFNSDGIYAIESLYCDDLPEFLLKVDEGPKRGENYRKAEDLSMGQRCTTVLPIIFAISSNPLFIDQPEDNLDNKFITERIHQIIREQKVSRQLIFITHNPNIPVLADAEQNTFFIYENRKAKVDATGNVEEVKTRIVSLLEGGKKAFERRMEIYGYPETE